MVDNYRSYLRCRRYNFSGKGFGWIIDNAVVHVPFCLLSLLY
jgi:hypothetical protein